MFVDTGKCFDKLWSETVEMKWRKLGIQKVISKYCMK